MSYDPAKDIPDLSGKTVLVTGGTSGLGRATVLHLAPHHPAKILFTGRNATAAEEVINQAKAVADGVETVFVPCDQASLASVREASSKILEMVTKLDIVILNGGVSTAQATTTADGYEIHFGTNHLGHFLLARLLIPVIVRQGRGAGAAGEESGAHGNGGQTANVDSGTRLVVISSMMHRFHPKGGIKFSSLKTSYRSVHHGTRYAQSKLANILFMKEFVRRYPRDESGVTAVAIHPGIVGTNMVAKFNWISRAAAWIIGGGRLETPEKGAWTLCWAATAKEEAHGLENGRVYGPVGKPLKTAKLVEDAELAKKLWEWSETEIDGKAHDRV